MPSERDIVFEDGTVWDGSDLEEPFFCRRLHFCKSCRNIMTSLERIKALYKYYDICNGPGEGEEEGEGGASLPCAMRAIALRVVEGLDGKRRFPGQCSEKREDFENPSKLQYWLKAYQKRRGGKHDITEVILKADGVMDRLLLFDVYAAPEDPAAQYVRTRPPLLDFPNESIPRISQWIDECSREHPECPQPRASPLPTRILDLGPPPQDHDGSGERAEVDDSVRVRDTEDGEVARYVALSYCWGGAQPVVLTRDSRAQMARPGGIALARLPRTIRDAVVATRALGLRYLWVDVLCIVQDCAEDVSRELNRMTRVFRNAWITLSAASAASCHDGFLQHRRPRRSVVPRFELPFGPVEGGGGGEAPGTVVLGEAFWHYAYDEPVNQRAWCFQESLLSPRVAVFGTHELLWQCCKVSDPVIAGGAGHSYDEGHERLPRAYLEDDSSSDGVPAPSAKDLETAWYFTVINYSYLSLTYDDDRLVALAALASEHQRLLGDTYVAGLWRGDLGLWLHWIIDPKETADRRCGGPQPLRPRPRATGTVHHGADDGYVAPSWSWASARGTISIAGGEDFCAEVLRCEVELRDASLPTGAVTGAVLVLRVPVREAGWEGQALLASAAPGAERVGRAFMDAEEERPAVVLCAALWGAYSGLILVRHGDAGAYSRIGYYEMQDIPISKEEWYAGMSREEWFAGCEPRVITLV